MKNIKIIFLILASAFLFTMSPSLACPACENSLKERKTQDEPTNPQAKESINQDTKETSNRDTNTQSNQDIKILKFKNNLAWNEKLKLRDFYISSSYPNLISDKENFKKYMERLAKEYEEHTDVFSVAIGYGLLLVDTGELEKAKTVFDRAVKVFRGNPTPPVYKAWIDASLGDYESAKNIWYPVLKEKIDQGINASIWLPNHSDSVLGLYLILDNLKDESEKKKIEKEVLTVAKHFGNHPKLSAILINNYLQEGNLSKANEALTNIISKYPNEFHLQTLQGILKMLGDDFEGSLESFNLVVESYPYSPTAFLMKARALDRLKKKDESLAILNRAIPLEKSFAGYKETPRELLAKKLYFSKPKKKPYNEEKLAEDNK